MHENGSLEVTPVFSTKASAIFIAAKDLQFRFQHNGLANKRHLQYSFCGRSRLGPSLAS
ncbi:hypothetical protein SBA2_120001 [Acidobacteriia bacterium SbA2]|nr:hypothetical protein SBA2_120001 [Acidobacteriia bacterium SbA2]